MNIELGRMAWLPLDAMTEDHVIAIKQKLTVIPRSTSEYSDPQPISLWEERPGYLGVPREWFFLTSTKAHNVTHDIAEGKSPSVASLKFADKVTLRPEQKETLEKFYAEFTGGKLGGILQAAAGWGKTVWACSIIPRLGRKTLVLVHKEFLMNQWADRIKEFLPKATVGFIQGETCDLDADIVVGMLQSLSQREYPASIYTSFGLVIGDEIHRGSAPTWSKVIPKFNARWRLGLTATPRRKDGTEQIFYWNVGPVLFRAKERMMTPNVRRIRTGFRFVQMPGQKDMNYAPRAIQIRVLCASKARNDVILKELRQAVAAGRKVLVLSERLKHLGTLCTMFQASPEGAGVSTGYYVGGMAEEALDETAKARVLFATVQMVQEGLDIPDLDTLLMTTPMSDPEQAIGRIQRVVKEKKTPIVTDFVDEIPWCESQAGRRESLYRHLGFGPKAEAVQRDVVTAGAA